MQNTATWRRILIAAAMVAGAMVVSASPGGVTPARAQALCQPTYVGPPPVGFNPLTATDSQLRCYGFPRRPTDTRALAAWQNAMRHAVDYVTPVLKLGTRAQEHTGFQNFYNGSWTGYEAPSSMQWTLNPRWDEAYAYWNVPTVGCEVSGNFVSPWVGIGQFNSNVLQAGTDSFQCTGAPVFWFENFAGSLSGSPCSSYYYQCPYYLSTFKINPGDQVYVDVLYQGGSDVTFYFEDLTLNTYTSVPISNLNSAYVDQGGAECIVEENEVVSFSQINFSNCILDANNTVGWVGAYNGYDFFVCQQEGGANDVYSWYADTSSALTSSNDRFTVNSTHVLKGSGCA